VRRSLGVSDSELLLLVVGQSVGQHEVRTGLGSAYVTYRIKRQKGLVLNLYASRQRWAQEQGERHALAFA
jgi:hypothetical protein